MMLQVGKWIMFYLEVWLVFRTFISMLSIAANGGLILIFGGTSDQITSDL